MFIVAVLHTHSSTVEERSQLNPAALAALVTTNREKGLFLSARDGAIFLAVPRPFVKLLYSNRSRVVGGAMSA